MYLNIECSCPLKPAYTIQAHIKYKMAASDLRSFQITNHKFKCSTSWKMLSTTVVLLWFVRIFTHNSRSHICPQNAFRLCDTFAQMPTYLIYRGSQWNDSFCIYLCRENFENFNSRISGSITKIFLRSNYHCKTTLIDRGHMRVNSSRKDHQIVSSVYISTCPK